MLGDKVEEVLGRMGVNQERVQRWVGECCCKERKEKLNQLHRWAIQSLKGLSNPLKYLNNIIGSGDEREQNNKGSD